MRRESDRLKLCLLVPAAILATAPLMRAVRGDEKTNYQDHALPIFRNSCLGCHNPDKKKAGLDLSSYAGAMAGSDNGPVVNAGDATGSKLYKSVTHAEDPTMPPKKEKLPDKELEVLRKWIAGGALETANGKPAAPSKPKVDLTLAASSLGKPTGPIAMPRGLVTEPVVRTHALGAIPSLAASPWGPIAAVGGQKQILLYQTQTLELVGVLPFPEGVPQILRFSRNGSLLLAGGGQAAKSGKVVLFDVATGNRVAEIGDEFDSVLAADLSPDQSMVVLGGPGRIVKAFSVADGKLIYAIKKHTDWVTAIAFAPDGVLLATADRAGGLAVWEAKTGHEFYPLAGHKESVTSVAFRDDANVLASCSTDGTIKLWNMQEGTEIKSWAAHGNYRAPTGAVGAGTFDPGVGAFSVDFAHDGRIVSCGRDKTVKIWDANGGAIRQMEGALPDTGLHATFDFDGARIIAGDLTGQIKVWSVADGKPAGELSDNPPTLAERFDATSKGLADAEAAADKASAELAAAQGAMDKAGADLQAAKQSAADAKKAADSARAQSDAATASSTAAAAALKAAQVDATAKQADATKFQQASDQAAEAVRKATAERMSMNEPLAAKSKARDDQQKMAADAKAESDKASDNSELKKKADDAKAMADKAAAELADLQKSAADKDHQVASLSAEAEKAKGAAAGASSALAAAQQALTAKQSEMDKATNTAKAATESLAKAMAAIDPAEKQVAPKADAVKAAAEQFAKIKSAADGALTKLLASKVELAKLKAQQANVVVAGARKDLLDRQAEQTAATDAAKAAVAAVDKANSDIAAATKSVGEAPMRLKALTDASDKAKAALSAALAAEQAAKAAVAEREGLVRESTALLEKITAIAAKAPNDKALADASTGARSSLDLLNADLASARQAVQLDGVKHAQDDFAAAEAAIAKEKSGADAAPKQLEKLRQQAADAAAEVPKKKAAVDTFAQPISQAQARFDQAKAEYDRLNHEAEKLAPTTVPTTLPVK